MIRVATLADADEIVLLIQQFYDETFYATLAPFNNDTIKSLTDNLIRKGIVVIAKVDHRIVGVLGLVVAPFIFNQDIKSCNEVVWWVHPDYRNAKLGIDMIIQADAIRKLRGCTVFQMAHLETSPAKVSSMLKSLGFIPTEHCYSKVK